MHASEHRPTKLGLAFLGHVYANVIVCSLGVLEVTTFLEGLQFINSSLLLIPLSICYFTKRSKLHGGKYTISEKVHYIEKNTLLHGREYGYTTQIEVLNITWRGVIVPYTPAERVCGTIKLYGEGGDS